MGAEGKTQPAFVTGKLSNSRRLRYTAGALLSLLVIFLLSRSHPPATLVANLRGARGGNAAVYNSTLGFQKVFALGFPGRTDKRDALIMASSFSGFDITWQDAVSFEDIPEKAIPETFGNHGVEETAIACWRAHLNIIAKIVDEKIETALIMEDDVDWDINIKAQLEVFARGTSALQKPTPGNSPRNSPYGNNWDLLWPGYCHSGPHERGEHSDQQSMYVIENDSTAPPVPFRLGWWAEPHLFPELLTNDTRLVYRSNKGMCLWGYAVSYEGARRILSAMSLQSGDESMGRQIDVSLSHMCENRELNSYAIWPPLFASHRFAGYRFRDSDIKDKDKDEWHEEFTAGIVYPTTMNVPRLLSGAEDAFSQWPNDTIPFRRLDESYVDQVSGRVKEFNLAALPEIEMKGVTIKGRFDTMGYLAALKNLGLQK